MFEHLLVLVGTPTITQKVNIHVFYFYSSLCFKLLFVAYAHLCGQAILYYCPRTDTEVTDNQETRQGRSHLLPSGLEVLGPALAPCLVLPSQQYPSVLITDVKSSNAVTIR